MLIRIKKHRTNDYDVTDSTFGTWLECYRRLVNYILPQNHTDVSVKDSYTLSTSDRNICFNLKYVSRDVRSTDGVILSSRLELELTEFNNGTIVKITTIDNLETLKKELSIDQ